VWEVDNAAYVATTASKELGGKERSDMSDSSRVKGVWDVAGEMAGCERELSGRDICCCNMGVLEMGEKKGRSLECQRRNRDREF
jgi:hypothetical protein